MFGASKINKLSYSRRQELVPFKNLGLGVESCVVWFGSWKMRKGNKVELLYFMITACKLNLTGLLLKIKELEQF